MKTLRQGCAPEDWKVVSLADRYTTLYTSPDPQNVYTGSPSIEVCPDGTIVASMDLFGPGVKALPGAKGDRPFPRQTMQGKVFTSDDGGSTWTFRTDFPFMHARLFTAGETLYLIGLCGDVKIMASNDGGTTWGEPVSLTDRGDWAQGATNVWKAGGYVYLVMMNLTTRDYKGYFPSVLSPVLFRAPENADLTDAGQWTHSQPMTAFRDLVPNEELDYFGLPFYSVHRDVSLDVGGGRMANAIGWHEAYVVQITDPDHCWFDSSGKTFHILARSDNHRSNFAAMAKVVERDGGAMELALETAPSGKKAVFLPMPGGHMKFHLLYDEPSALYWLVSSQSTDSMTRVDRLPPNRFNLPYNERRRLQLSYSKNLVDWCFAGLVSAGKSDLESRHYCGMAVRGDDLLVLSRSGDENAKNPHDTNLITLHTITRFRDLVY